MTKEEMATIMAEAVAQGVKAALGGMNVVEQHASTQDAIKTARTAGGMLDLGDVDKSVVFGRIVRALMVNKGDPDRALAGVKAGRFGSEKNIIEAVEKAMGAGDAGAGGYLLPTELSSEVIELLRATTVVRRANPRLMQMDVGSMEIPKIASGSNASYVGENEAGTVSGMGTGIVRLTYKKLISLVPVSNDLLRFGGASADMMVRDDMIGGMSVREDQAFLRGTGELNTPRGMRYWAAAANVTGTNGTDLASVSQDLSELMGALQDNNVPTLRCAWFMSPRTLRYLRFVVRDGNGNLVYGPELKTGMLEGFPVFATTSIPDNLGDGGNESEIILANMADMVLGDSSQITLDVSGDAAYVDENSNAQSAFTSDQTIVRAIARHDFVTRRIESIAVKTGILYGA